MRLRCDTSTEFTRLTYTGFGGLEHLLFCKIEGECVVVYYESIKRELQIRCIYECRCDERLQSKTKEFTHLGYTDVEVIGAPV